jgi:ribosomal protein S18 acetylase RimI-like enzyme
MVEIENLCFTEPRRFDSAYYSNVCQQFTPSLVTVIDGVVVGFAICRMTSDVEAYLCTLNVHPDFRGQGLAKFCWPLWKARLLRQT